MHWLKRDVSKAGIAIVGILFPLLLVVWVPMSAFSSYKTVPGLATPATVTVQTTPTEDATVTTLTKEQLTLQVKQLQNQFQNQNNWLSTNSTALIAAFATIVVALFGISQWAVNRRDEGLKGREAQDKELEDREAERERRVEEQLRWLKDQEAEREKRAEERFQAVVEGLGREKEESRVDAAITLRTFLRPGYEQFYTQTFDLAVAHLRLPRTSTPPEDPNAPLSLTTLSQALTVAFKDAFPLARDNTSDSVQGAVQSLDATGIKLDNAYLAGADLERVWMPKASLRKADLSGEKTNLSRANLREADLREADLTNANLGEADLSKADLSKADLREAKLKGTRLSEANLFMADLSRAILHEAILSDANLSEAELYGARLSGAKLRKATLHRTKLMSTDLSETDLSEADLSGANLNGSSLRKAALINTKLSGADLSETDLSEAELNGADLSGASLYKADLRGSLLIRVTIEDAYLSYTDLRGVRGLTKARLEACKEKGAIIDEDPTTSSS